MKSRIRAADALRGVSLLGIVLANLLIFQYGLIGKEYVSFYDLDEFSMTIYYVIKVLIEHSAMPIFTFLFGFSLIKLKDSLTRKGAKVNRNIIRRALMLIMFGFIHAFLIWEGDILVFYGFSCFFLLFFLKKSNFFLFSLFILTSIIIIVISFIPLDANVRALSYGGPITEDINNFLFEGKATYSEGTYNEIRYFSANEMPHSFNFSGGVMFGMYLLGQFLYLSMFLLGMIIAKSDLLSNIGNYLKQYCILTLLIPIGIILKIPHLFINYSLTDGLFTIGSLILSIGYGCLFLLLYHKYSSHKIMKSFEAVGKLSLTNYLVQSIIMTFIFYGYGLGLFGNKHLTLGFLIAIFVYLLQIGLSSYYLKYFNQGPIEYLLRVGTYFSFKSKSKNINSASFSSNESTQRK